MGKEEHIIMVIPREDLFKTNSLQNSPQGFLASEEYDFTSVIKNNFQWMRRGNAQEPLEKSAESNPSYKQPIAYSVIINKKTKKIFCYRRAQHGVNYNESRLAGNWSWGVGGHIEKIDQEHEKNGMNILQKSRDRELAEEVTLQSSDIPILAGYINDDANPVGSVHIGVLYIIQTNQEKIELADNEGVECDWKSISELEQLCQNAKINDTSIKVDTWSEIALTPIKELLEK